MGAVALVDLRLFFEVEEVHRCCRRALSAWLPCYAVYAVRVACRAASIRFDAMSPQRLMRAMPSQLLRVARGTVFAKATASGSKTLGRERF